MATIDEITRLTEGSTSREVTAGGLRITYNEAGTGDPILCIHGGGPGASGWSNFKGNLQDLALAHRVLMINMSGWGLSELPDSDLDFLTFSAGVVFSFFDALGIDKVDIIGNSMGGQIGVKTAIDHPDSVKHLVQIGGMATQAIALQAQPAEALNNIAKYYRGDGPSIEKMRTLAESLVFDQSMVTDATVSERFAASTTPEAVADSARRAKQPRNDLYFELASNRVPTLLVWGNEDKAAAIEGGLLMLRRFQNARMHIFQRCGHWAQVEKREEFDRLVLDFFST